MAAAPIVARLFVPEDYGIAALYLAIATIVAGVLPLGYQRAILFPREEGVGASLFLLAVVLCLLCTGLFYGILGLMTAVHPDIAARTGLHQLFWILPIGALLLALRDAMAVLLLRQSEFGSIARVDIVQSATMAGSRILWGVSIGSAAIGLVAGQILSLAVAICIAWRSSGRWLRETLDKVSWQALWRLAVEYKDYPRFRVFARLAFITANHTPVLALGLMYPSAVVGYFAMANRVVGMPMRTTSHAISDAILRNSIGERHENRPIGRSIWKAGFLLLAIGLPGLGLVYAFGGELLGLVLGERWRPAGEMLEILSVYIFSYWVASPFATVLETLRKNALQLIFHSTNLFATALTFTVCYMAEFSVFETLWSYNLVCCIYQVAVIGTAIGVMRKHDQRLGPLAT